MHCMASIFCISILFHVCVNVFICKYKRISTPFLPMGKICYANSSMNNLLAYHRFEVDGLANEFLLTKGVACFWGNGINRTLVNLLFHGSEQHEQGLPCTLPQEFIQEECEPRRQHLLSNTFCSVTVVSTVLEQKVTSS